MYGSRREFIKMIGIGLAGAVIGTGFYLNDFGKGGWVQEGKFFLDSAKTWVMGHPQNWKPIPEDKMLVDVHAHFGNLKNDYDLEVLLGGLFERVSWQGIAVYSGNPPEGKIDVLSGNPEDTLTYEKFVSALNSFLKINRKFERIFSDGFVTVLKYQDKELIVSKYHEVITHKKNASGFVNHLLKIPLEIHLGVEKIENYFARGHDTEKIIEAVKNDGGYVCLHHPNTKPYPKIKFKRPDWKERKYVKDLYGSVDTIEVFNSMNTLYMARCNGFSEDMNKRGVPEVANTDAHAHPDFNIAVKQLGLAGILIDKEKIYREFGNFKGLTGKEIIEIKMKFIKNKEHQLYRTYVDPILFKDIMLH